MSLRSTVDIKEKHLSDKIHSVHKLCTNYLQILHGYLRLWVWSSISPKDRPLTAMTVQPINRKGGPPVVTLSRYYSKTDHRRPESPERLNKMKFYRFFF